MQEGPVCQCPPEPTGRGSAQWRGHNSRGKRAGNRGGRGGGTGRRGSHWESWDQADYKSWEEPQDTSDQIMPKGKGRDKK
eukprot:8533845-Karenia_brevis.AAC.1